MKGRTGNHSRAAGNRKQQCAGKKMGYKYGGKVKKYMGGGSVTRGNGAGRKNHLMKNG
jgi:hypothetical protein